MFHEETILENQCHLAEEQNHHSATNKAQYTQLSVYCLHCSIVKFLEADHLGVPLRESVSCPFACTVNASPITTLIRAARCSHQLRNLSMPFLVTIKQRSESMSIRESRNSRDVAGDFTHTYLLMLPSLDR